MRKFSKKCILLLLLVVKSDQMQFLHHIRGYPKSLFSVGASSQIYLVRRMFGSLETYPFQALGFNFLHLLVDIRVVIGTEYIFLKIFSSKYLSFVSIVFVSLTYIHEHQPNCCCIDTDF